MGKPFRFKQFSIQQENAAMKVGTDAVLLGALANHPAPKHILDIGSGTGIIGLMLAQRFPEAKVDLLEKDPVSYEEAKLNSDNSPFAERMRTIQSSFETHPFDSTYDLIVSNPPYHLEDFLSENGRRSNTRSTNSLEPAILMEKSMGLLKDDGQFWLICPPAYFKLCIELGFGHLIHQTDILPKANRELKRVVSCWGKEKFVPKKKTFILRKEDNDYSNEYKTLTTEFHPHY